MKRIAIAIAVLLIATAVFAANVGNTSKHIIFKGINTKAGPMSLDDGESPDCLNVHTSLYGTLIKRKGFTKITGAHTHVTTAPGATNGLYDYAVNGTTSYLMGFLDNALYKMDNLDGTWDPITVHATALSNDIMSFENFDGTLLFTTRSQDNLRYWTGSGAMSHVQITPRGKYIFRAYNRVFLGDCLDESGTAEPLRFYFSNAGSYTSWTDTSGIYYYETLDAPNGDSIMGWGFCRGSLYGFTKYTVSIIADVGGADIVQAEKRLQGTGCGASRSIKTVNHPQYGEILVWLTNDKRLVAWTGYGAIKDIGEKIQTYNGQSNFYLNLISSTYLYKAHAQVYEKEGYYVLWVPGSTTIEYAVVYDYKTESIWIYDNQDFDSSAVVNTSTGNLIYVGDRYAKAYKWDDGNSDDGSAINGYWSSRKWDFGFMPSLKKMGEVDIITKTIGSYNLKYQYRYNWSTSYSTAEDLTMIDDEWVLGDVLPATLGGNIAKRHRLGIDGAYNLFQLKLSDNTTNPAFEVYSLDLATNNLGSPND